LAEGAPSAGERQPQQQRGGRPAARRKDRPGRQGQVCLRWWGGGEEESRRAEVQWEDSV